jgi:ribosomal protein L29
MRNNDNRIGRLERLLRLKTHDRIRRMSDAELEARVRGLLAKIMNCEQEEVDMSPESLNEALIKVRGYLARVEKSQSSKTFKSV